MIEPYHLYRKRYPVACAQTVAEERQRFGHILDDAVNEAAYNPAGDTVDILLPGCGACIEAPVLVEHFGGPGNTRQVNLTGLDIMTRRVEIAREQVAGLPGNHTFLAGSAETLDGYPEVASRFDVALFRRQNCGAAIGPDEWRGIFKHAMDRVDLGGVAIVTSLGWEEHTQMIELFQSLGHQPTAPKPILTRYHHESQQDDNSLSIMPIDFCYSVFRKDHVA